MKKITLMSLVLLMCVSSFAALIFRTKQKGTDYEMTNAENRKINNYQQVYLIMDYDYSTHTYSNATLIYFWKDRSKRRQKTVAFKPVIEEVTVSGGRRALATITQNDETEKHFETLISDPIKFHTGYTTAYPFPSKFTGRKVYETVNDLGERLIGSVGIKFRINRKWTLQFIDGDAAGAISAIQEALDQQGYKEF